MESVDFWKKAIANDISNWEQTNNKVNKQQNGFRKNKSTNDSLFKLRFETIKYGFHKDHLTTGTLLMSKKPCFDGLFYKLTIMGPKMKLIR